MSALIYLALLAAAHGTSLAIVAGYAASTLLTAATLIGVFSPKSN